MSETASIAEGTTELGGYRIDRVLAEGRSYLATAPTGRAVVLKILGSDCLLGGQLHPMIKDRLGRIRELAHLGVASLLGAERAGDSCFLVWDHVKGVSLEEHLGMGGRPALEVARKLVLNVEALHALGIVHGALHPRNVFVTPSGAIRLTHVSPLLYTDPQDDADAVAEMLEAMGWPVGAEEGSVATLREMAGRLMAAPALPIADGPRALPPTGSEPRWRWGALVTAGVVVLLGLLLAVWIWRWARDAGARSEGPFRGGAVVGVVLQG